MTGKNTLFSSLLNSNSIRIHMLQKLFGNSKSLYSRAHGILAISYEIRAYEIGASLTIRATRGTVAMKL